MKTYRYTVTLTLRAPVLSQAAGGRSIGIDAAALRHDDRPALPGSLIRGNLRHAWEYFDRAFPKSGAPSKLKIETWLGRVSGEGTNDEPKRARLQFAAFWVARAGGGEGKRHRIKIDPEKGTVEHRHLQTIEAPFAAHSEVVYEGHIDALCEDETEAKDLGRWIRKALEFTPALGAFKGAGFGRIVAVTVAVSERRALSADPRPAVAERFGIRLRLDRPFCFAKPHPPESNRYESEDFIPGGAILGALARRVFPGGRDAHYADDCWKPLRDAFHQIRVTHVRPGTKGSDKRSIVLPQSLVFNPDEKVPQPYDVALKRVPVLIDSQDPIFSIDWKSKHWAAAGALTGADEPPERVIIVRTQIQPETGAALESALFAVEAVRPDKHEWLAEVDLRGVTTNRDQVATSLLELLSEGLDMLGKTKAVAEVEVLPTPVVSDWDSSPKLRLAWLDDGQEAWIAVVTLQSAARLLPRLRDIPATNGDEALAEAYGETWRELSSCDNVAHLSLLWYYAEERLVGGNYLWHRFGGKQDPYNPEVLTMPGSVFVLKLTGDKEKAEERLRDWLAHGLPQLQDAPGGEDWQRTPYIRNNGYGEVAINLDLHWIRKPGPDVCEELPDD